MTSIVMPSRARSGGVRSAAVRTRALSELTGTRLGDGRRLNAVEIARLADLRLAALVVPIDVGLALELVPELAAFACKAAAVPSPRDVATRANTTHVSARGCQNRGK